VSAPHRRRDWVPISVAAVTRFASGILMGTALAVLVERQATPFAASLVLSAYFAGLMLFAPVWGAVADVTGRRRAVLVGTGALATLSVLPLVVVEGVWAPIAVRGVYAVFAAGFAPVMLAIVSQRGGREGRGRSIGGFNSARAVGFAGGQLTVGALLGLLAPDGLYLVIAATSLVSTVAVLFVPTGETGGDDSEGADAADLTLRELAGEVRGRLLPGVDERDHLRANGLWWLYVALALRNMTVLGVMSVMAPFLLTEVGVREVVMGVLLAVNPVGQAAFMLPAGWAADRFGRKPLVVAGMAGSGAFALVARAATLPAAPLARAGVAALAFVVIAASFSVMTAGAVAFIGDVAPPTRESELMGLRSTAKGLGGVLGPPLVGAVATAGSYELAFALGSSLAFLAAVLVARRTTESHPGRRSGSARVGASPVDD
jgi:MFS family permease